MNLETRQSLCEKAREFGRIVASTDTTGLPPVELLGICSMCKALDRFLDVFENCGAK